MDSPNCWTSEEVSWEKRPFHMVSDEVAPAGSGAARGFVTAPPHMETRKHADLSSRAFPVDPRRWISIIAAMAKIIPLISSGTAGPLGVLHLPRLWLKASLGAAGKLHPDYPAVGSGYDQMVLDGLGIEREAFVNFIATAKPTYPQCEAWILEQNGGSLDAAKVAELNAAITGYLHADETRKAILDAAGVPDDGTILDAINLNNLDDWAGIHREVIAE